MSSVTLAYLLLGAFFACVSTAFQVTPAKQPVQARPLVLFVAGKEIELDFEEREDATSLRSITFSNLREDQEPQLLSNFLMELGACSTSMTDSDLGTPGETPLFDEFDATTMTRTAVTLHVWNHCNVQAHFPASTDLQWIMELVNENFPNLPIYEVAQVENKDWVLHVQQAWEPIILPPFILKFPWHTPDTVAKALKSANIEESANFCELKLQGGIAFGTGEHPTTQLCLDWVGKILDNNKGNIKRVMDYGSGSGVLGMAACKLDPTVAAVGVDIDVDAIQIANENAEANSVNMINYLSDLVQTMDDESRSVLLRGFSSKKGEVSQVIPKDANGPIYDVCVANILAGPLVTLAPVLAGLVRPGGFLGLSGIMKSQSGMILEAYSEYFDNPIVENELNGWILVTGQRKQD